MMIVGSSAQQRAIEQLEPRDDDRPCTNAVARQLVDIEILYLLSFGAKSGYELRKLLSAGFGIRVSYGTLYPHLHALEKSNFISGIWSHKEGAAPLKKRVYSLSKEGTAILRDSVKSLGSISMTMQLLTNHVNLNSENTTVVSNANLAQFETTLSRRGYLAKEMALVKGLTGTEHRIDRLAFKKTDGSPSTTPAKIMLKVVDIDSPLTIDQLFKTHVIANDIQARIFLLAVPPMRKELRDLAEFYEMMVFEGTEWSSVGSAFETNLDSCLNRPLNSYRSLRKRVNITQNDGFNVEKTILPSSATF